MWINRLRGGICSPTKFGRQRFTSRFWILPAKFESSTMYLLMKPLCPYKKSRSQRPICSSQNRIIVTPTPPQPGRDGNSEIPEVNKLTRVWRTCSSYHLTPHPCSRSCPRSSCPRSSCLGGQCDRTHLDLSCLPYISHLEFSRVVPSSKYAARHRLQW